MIKIIAIRPFSENMFRILSITYAIRPFSENMFRILSITYSGVTSFDQKYYRDLLSSRRDKSDSLYITNEGQ